MYTIPVVEQGHPSGQSTNYLQKVKLRGSSSSYGMLESHREMIFKILTEVHRQLCK